MVLTDGLTKHGAGFELIGKAELCQPTITVLQVNVGRHSLVEEIARHFGAQYVQPLGRVRITVELIDDD